MKLAFPILFFPLLAQAASSIHTGFNYGAFWGSGSNVKHENDFLDSFKLAKNLKTSVPFDSARLFTCITAGTQNDYTGAFDAAVESKTNLLLGFYTIPATRGVSPDAQVRNEMLALEKGFRKHGQALADLVIGLSVGNEDIYHREEMKDGDGKPTPGNSAEVITATIVSVRKLIASSSFAKYMQGKPIGHVDTAKYAAKVKGVDFIGMTAYPWWANETIGNAKASFHKSLGEVRKEAGNTPVWIAEMGWPAASNIKGLPNASVDDMQSFWTDVGCSVLGRYTTFWFELLRDSEANQPDWGLLDVGTKQPRIKDLSCPSRLPSASASTDPLPGVPPPSSRIEPTTKVPSSSSPPTSRPLPTVSQISTCAMITVTTTINLTRSTLASSRGTTNSTPISYHTSYVSNIIDAQSPTAKSWCITEADVYRDGNYMTVAGGPASPDGTCNKPSTYSRHPHMTSRMYAKPTETVKDRTWCITMANLLWDGSFVPVDGNPARPDGKCTTTPVFNGHPYVNSTSSSVPQSSAPSAGLASVRPQKTASPATSSSILASSVHRGCARRLNNRAQPSPAGLAGDAFESCSTAVASKLRSTGAMSEFNFPSAKSPSSRS